MAASILAADRHFVFKELLHFFTVWLFLYLNILAGLRQIRSDLLLQATHRWVDGASSCRVQLGPQQQGILDGIGLCLGVALCIPHKCQYGNLVGPKGHRGFVWRRTLGHSLFHHAINDISVPCLRWTSPAQNTSRSILIGWQKPTSFWSSSQHVIISPSWYN